MFVLIYFLLVAVLLAAAYLVVEVAAGPVNRLLLAWLFCDFSHPPSLDLNLGGEELGAHLKLVLFTPQVGCWGCPLVAVGCWPWPVGWATRVVHPKVEEVAADLPLVA